MTVFSPVRHEFVILILPIVVCALVSHLIDVAESPRHRNNCTMPRYTYR